jgi:cation diffusion facilitator family transporter
MHVHDLRPFSHSHAFGDSGMAHRARALLQVTWITLATMAAELAAGWWSGSLALTADGWHMGTHALALGGAVLAYRLSARASGREGFAFGGWKIEVLAAYTSGLALLAAAAWLVVDSIATLRAPHDIAYGEAMVVAAIGLAVNLASAWLLARGEKHGAAQATRRAGGDPHGHHDAHDHARGHAHGAASHAHHHHHGHDHNFSAAYLHVVADAFTSVLAIAALAGGLWFGAAWLDPAVALLGAAVIARWSFGVLAQSARGLIDATADPHLVQRIRDLIEADRDAKIADLHVWQVGTSAWSAVVSVVADRPLSAEAYRSRLAPIAQLRHVTVEVHPCSGAAPERP